jgi:hypothetical protein
MYANDEPSSWEEVPAAEEPAAAPFANREDENLITEQATAAVPIAEPASGNVDSGLLMSFLSDFRTAEYEQMRKQREEELAKTRKRPPRPVPVDRDPEDLGLDLVEPAAYVADDYPRGEDAGPAVVPQAPIEETPIDQWAPPQWAADQCAEPPADPETAGRKPRRLFGWGSKNVQQSPATT